MPNFLVQIVAGYDPGEPNPSLRLHIGSDKKAVQRRIWYGILMNLVVPESLCAQGLVQQLLTSLDTLMLVRM